MDLKLQEKVLLPAVRKKLEGDCQRLSMKERCGHQRPQSDDLRRAKEGLGGNVSIYQADVTVKKSGKI